MTGFRMVRDGAAHGRAHVLRAAASALLLAWFPITAAAQAPTKTPKASADTTALLGPLFRQETPLAVTFTANIRQLRRDKADKEPWRAATIAFTDDAGKAVTLAARTKTHGVFRLKTCDFPPLRLDVVGAARRSTVFRDVGNMKMVNFCKNNDRFDQLILREFQLYRVYRTLTPASHHVRLMRVTYVDSATRQPHATRYSFLIEAPERMAARLGGKLIELKGARPEDLDPPTAAVALLFEYLIGNADFSFSGLHNTELVGRLDGINLPVVYDFDFSGAVNAPYATPDPMFNIKSVRERVFRGFCKHRGEFPAALRLLQEKKEAIYALYRDDLGKLMDRRDVDETLEYFDAFYESLATPRQADRIFAYCVGPR